MQHYLPKAHLRGFTNCGLRKKKNGKLRVIDFVDRKTFSASPGEVARVRDYYVFQNTDGKDDYRVETEIFKQIDGAAPRIIREMEEKRTIPTGEDWELLCAFVVFLELRVPRFRQVSQEISQHVRRNGTRTLQPRRILCRSAENKRC